MMGSYGRPAPSNTYTGSPKVLMGNGDCTFQPRPRSSWEPGRIPTVADLNGEGSPDIALLPDGNAR
jgi:hypothetical protein